MNAAVIKNTNISPMVPLDKSDDNEGVYFSAYEWKVFTEELKLGKDVKTALHNARYYGELKRRIDDTEVGRNTVTFSEEEFEAMINQ